VYAELRQCLTDAGYGIYASQDFPVIDRPPGASSAQELAIALTEATCNDSLRIAQRLGDIEATYQQLLIAEHEAELLAIRADVDARLERAHAILREVGLE
jgi:hypothetical protein